MAISSDMEMSGSVSGGCVEGAVVQEALTVMESGQPVLLEYGTMDMEPRPYMTPMALWLEGEVEGIVTRYIRAVR
jgi:xanthine/CO dehydrogenase XdhC/CoxF family maturation factor